MTVFGYNPDFPGNPPDDPAPNTAMIFDATCAGGCSGGDDDLDFPELGNGLIISEDLDSSDPDDADNAGAFFLFDFSSFIKRKVKVKVESLIVADVDEAVGEIRLYRNGTLVKTVPFPPTRNHEKAPVLIGVEDIHRMEVSLNGSGMIDNIEIEIEEPSPHEASITLDGICEPQGTLSNDLQLWGVLTRDENTLPDHDVKLILPNGETVTRKTEDDGSYGYRFKDARKHIDKIITAVATVDGRDYSAQHEIAEKDFVGCLIPADPGLTIEGICEKKTGQSESHDLSLTGMLTGSDGSGVPNHPITLNLPDREELVFVTTDPAGNYSYLFVGAYQYLGLSLIHI